MVRLLGALVLLGLALLTAQRVLVWQDDVTLWADAQRTAPTKPRPAVNLAGAFLRQRDLSAAEGWATIGQELADHRDGMEYREGRAYALATLALVDFERGKRAHGALLLREVLTADVPQVTALCARFHCQ